MKLIKMSKKDLQKGLIKLTKNNRSCLASGPSGTSSAPLEQRSRGWSDGIAGGSVL